MKSIAILGPALLLLAATGCGRPRTAPMAQAVPAPRIDGRPSWVFLPQSCPDVPATSIAEVGSEGANAAGDLMLQRKLALLHARYQVGARLSVGVQGFLKQAQLTDASATARKGHAVSDQAVLTGTQGHETELVDATLSGVTPREFWIEPGTARLYVLVTLDREAIGSALQTSMGGRYRDAAARIADSQKILDDMLAAKAGQAR
jgi:hypothetical protein